MRKSKPRTKPRTKRDADLITREMLLDAISAHLQGRFEKQKVIVLIGKDGCHVTMTIPAGNYVKQRWFVRVQEDSDEEYG